MERTDTMAIDQYGQTFHALGRYPRKELLKRLGYKAAKKMYRDRTGGAPVHVGYVIGSHWLELFAVSPWEGGGHNG